MPRHGSAVPGADVDGIHDASRGSRMAGWTIRRKLSLLAIIPMIVLLIGGGVFATSVALDYRGAHTTRSYADTLVPALRATQALGNEFASPGTLTDKTKLAAARKASDDNLRQLTPDLQDMVDAKGAMEERATDALAAIKTIPDIRTRIDGLIAAIANGSQTAGSINGAVRFTSMDATTRLRTFVIALAGQIQAITPSQSIINNASVVTSVTQLIGSARDEQTLYTLVFLGATTVSNDTLAQDAKAAAGQILSQQRAVTVATADQKLLLRKWYDAEIGVDNWRQIFQTKPSASNPGRAQLWLNTSNAHIAQISDTVDQVATQTRSQAHNIETQTLIRAAVIGAAVVATLLVVSALLAAIARTVTGPLRRLRAGAVDIASVQLPAAVARIEQDGVAADVSLPAVLPADIAAGPETFEVARAVDDLGAEAVRLATAQVRLRRALDEAFVSMSRRSQSMVEKQLAIIDDLESQEQDPDQLRNLFRLDHLAARMRRYNDNLLVLAGSAVRTRATAPVKVAELFRAATSEMEQYERVRLQPVSGASIAGTVAGELVHLLAELLDNAAMYSPPSSQIVLSAAFTADGGLQIEVLDAGVGISPGELDRLNARLTQPEAIDTQVPSRMGLFVVARLARRGGFGVMLQSRSDAAGTIALVRVPATLVVGAPGSTGEQPAMARSTRPATPISGTAVPQPAPFSAPGLPPAPAVAAAGAAAAAAAGIRSFDQVDQGAAAKAPALPRRRRGGNGLPPQASVPAPAGDLFAPSTPASDDADSPSAGSAGRASSGAFRRSAPPETTPTGISSPGMHDGATGTSEPASTPLPPVGPADPADPATTALPVSRLRRQPDATPPAPDVSPGADGDASAETPAAGLNGLPVRAPSGRASGRSAPGRAPQSPPAQAHGPQDPLTTPSGEFRALPNPVPSAEALGAGAGAAPSAWDDALPTELAARSAAAASYKPKNPDAPMIGDDAALNANDPTPIFDQISVWFTAEPTGSLPVVTSEGDKEVIDLRTDGRADGSDGQADGLPERQPSSRWQSLGDQRWLATNARAAAAPDTEGTTETGLPLRRPGANLLPSASAAAPAAPIGLPAPGAARTAKDASADNTSESSDPDVPVDADLVRGRLGGYQRGLANARKARSQPAPEPAFDPVGASLFTTNSDASEDAARTDEQGADQ